MSEKKYCDNYSTMITEAEKLRRMDHGSPLENGKQLTKVNEAHKICNEKAEGYVPHPMSLQELGNIKFHFPQPTKEELEEYKEEKRIRDLENEKYQPFTLTLEEIKEQDKKDPRVTDIHTIKRGDIEFYCVTQDYNIGRVKGCMCSGCE